MVEEEEEEQHRRRHDMLVLMCGSSQRFLGCNRYCKTLPHKNPTQALCQSPFIQHPTNHKPSVRPYLGVWAQGSRRLLCGDHLLGHCTHPDALHTLHTHWVDGVCEAGCLLVQCRSKGPHLSAVFTSQQYAAAADQQQCTQGEWQQCNYYCPVGIM